MVEEEFKIIKTEDATYYFKGNVYHREDGPALEYNNGNQEWYINGLLHREDGPAYISMNNKYKEWWLNGKLHRLDGPAIEFISGDKDWYINGNKINCFSQEQFEKILKLKAFM